MAVGVLEPGQEQTAAEINDIRPGPYVRGDLTVVTDSNDSPAVDRHRPTPATRRVGGEHRSVDENEAGGHGRAVCQGIDTVVGGRW